MISRRAFLKGGALLGGGLLLEGFVVEPRMVDITETTVRVNGLPAAFNGFRICQITDVHHSSVVGLEYIKSVVEEANRLRPDLVVLTGDYIDTGKKYMAPCLEALAGAKAKYGTIAILGNHDYFTGKGHGEEVMASNKIPLLQNSHLLIESKGSALCVAGVADLLEGTPDASVALKGVDPAIPRILLSHHPDYAEALPKGERVDLVISGHTHGGQVRLPFGHAPVVPSSYGQKYSGGLVRLDSGTQVYVSRGIGVSMIPVRFNCPPELALIKLAA
jgi:predicted MPP superfamily phosphohydrolase